MQTPTLNIANISAAPMPAQKQNNNAAQPDTQFNQVLSREVVNRQNSNKETSKTPPKEVQKNNAPKQAGPKEAEKNSPPKQVVQKNDAETPVEGKVEEAQEATATVDVPVENTAPSDLLALVHQLTMPLEPRSLPTEIEKKTSAAADTPLVSTGKGELAESLGASKLPLESQDKPAAAKDASAMQTAFAAVMKSVKESPTTAAVPEADLSKAGKTKGSLQETLTAAMPAAKEQETLPEITPATKSQASLTEMLASQTTKKQEPLTETQASQTIKKQEPLTEAQTIKKQESPTEILSSPTSEKQTPLTEILSTANLVKVKEAPADLAGALKVKEMLPQATPLAAPTVPLNAAETQQAEKLSPPVGARGWDQALGQKIVWMATGGMQSASMTLNPPNLGPLQVVLNITNDQANATFIAAQPEVRQAIEAAMPKLREMMSEAGVQLGSATVSTGMPNHQSAPNDQQQSGVSRFEKPSFGLEAPLPSTATTIVSGGQGLVDTFA